MTYERAADNLVTTGGTDLAGEVGRLLDPAGAPGSATARPVLERSVLRDRSIIHFLRSSSAQETPDIVVKEPRPGAAQQPRSIRPRLAAPPTAEARYEREHAALRLVAAELAARPEPGVRAAAILGFLPDRHALVMEHLREPTLRDALYRRTLGGRVRRDWLVEATAHAGRWLARYHALPPPAGTEPRQADRADVAALAAGLATYIAGRAEALGRTSDAAALRQRTPAVLALVEHALPARLPLALGHGDYAPRNILVGPRGDVTVIDAWARWTPPVQEDLATFLGSLRTSMPQVLSAGLYLPPPVAARLERAFLDGYGPVPAGRDALRAYEVVLLLDRWGSIPGVESRASTAAAMRARLQWRAYRAELDRLLGATRA